jgi:hypothetical protein
MMKLTIEVASNETGGRPTELTLQGSGSSQGQKRRDLIGLWETAKAKDFLNDVKSTISDYCRKEKISPDEIFGTTHLRQNR